MCLAAFLIPLFGSPHLDEQQGATDKKQKLSGHRTQKPLTDACTRLQLLLSLAEGNAFSSLALAKVQAHSVIFRISWWGALTAIPWRQTPIKTQSRSIVPRAQQSPRTSKQQGLRGLLWPEGNLTLIFKYMFTHYRIPGEATETHTCAIRHAFASSINSLLALLLGCLKLTIFTARTVPITMEEQTNTIQSNDNPTSKAMVVLVTWTLKQDPRAKLLLHILTPLELSALSVSLPDMGKATSMLHHSKK